MKVVLKITSVGLLSLLLTSCSSGAANESGSQVAASTSNSATVTESQPVVLNTTQAAAETLSEIADAIGCTGYVPKNTPAPGAIEHGRCTFNAKQVKAYAFKDEVGYSTFVQACAAYGVTEESWVRKGLFVFAPDDQNQISALKSALGA
jgi:hypothetical protein